MQNSHYRGLEKSYSPGGAPVLRETSRSPSWRLEFNLRIMFSEIKMTNSEQVLNRNMFR